MAKITEKAREKAHRTLDMLFDHPLFVGQTGCLTVKIPMNQGGFHDPIIEFERKSELVYRIEDGEVTLYLKKKIDL